MRLARTKICIRQLLIIGKNRYLEKTCLCLIDEMLVCEAEQINRID
jgi:hypothetical protein